MMSPPTCRALLEPSWPGFAGSIPGNNTTFHLCKYGLLRLKQSLEKEIQLNLEIITCDSSIYTMDHPKFTVSNQKDESISTWADSSGTENLCNMAHLFVCLVCGFNMPVNSYCHVEMAS